MEEIVSKIEHLYSSDPSQVVEIQRELQQVQRSKDACELAMALIQMPSKNCKFFGALTFSVFINQNEGLTGDEVAELENKWTDIIAYLMVSQPENMIVIRKMLSNILVLFFKYYKEIQNPMWSILGKIGGSKSLGPLIGSLSIEKLTLIATFYSSMAEEAVKRELVPGIHAVIKNQLFPDFTTLIQFSDQNVQHNKDYEELILDTISSWISYISYAESKSDVRYNEEIDFIFEYLSKKLLIQKPGDVSEDEWENIKRAMYILSDANELSSRLLTKGRKAMLFGILVNEFGPLLMNFVFETNSQDEYSEIVESFVNLLITFLNLDMEVLVRKFLQPETQNVLKILIGLTDYPGHAVIDEQISSQLIIFWEDFASLFANNNDEYNKDEESSQTEFIKTRNEMFQSVCKIYWRKCQLPSADEYLANLSDLSHYRNEVADMFIEIYPLMEELLYGELIGSVVSILKEQSLDEGSVIRLESSLFLLYKITDVLTFYDSVSMQLQESLITEMFNHDFIAVMSRIPKSPFYSVLFSTVIKFLFSIQFFYRKQPGYIGSVLELLFSTIFDERIRNVAQGSISQSSERPSDLILLASKAISKMCNESSSNLISFIPNLSTLVVQMIRDTDVDGLIRERLCNSLISIVHNTKDSEKLSRAISAIFAEIFTMTETAMAFEFNEHTEKYLISLLECVYQIGYACQLPDDMEDFFDDSQQQAVSQFWSNDPDNIKPSILSLIELYSLKYSPLIENNSVTNKCYMILNVGLHEPIDGPYNFEKEVIFNYSALKIERCDLLSIACIHKSVAKAIVANHKKLAKQSIDEIIEKIFVSKLHLIQSDFELISSSNEFFSVILDKSPSLILSSKFFPQAIVNFTLLGLSSSQGSNIKTVSKFWTSLLSLKRGSREDHQMLQALIIDQNLGSLLTANLTKAFLKAFRQMLDWYYPIFRTIISKFTLHFKNWFKTVLNELNDKHLDEKTINKIVSQLLLTRGHREANSILMKLWSTCNGSIDSKSKNYK